MRVVFADTRWGVIKAREILGRDCANADLVTVSAEACEAASASGVRHRPISTLINAELRIVASQREAFSPWLGAMHELETLLAAEFSDCRFEGPGILMSRAYSTALAINAVRYRVGLMVEAVRVLAPSDVTIIETYINSAFDGDGYHFNPWTLAFHDWLERQRIKTELLFSQPEDAKPSLYTKATAWARKQPILRRWKRVIDNYRSSPVRRRQPADLRDLRIIFSDTIGYDWLPVHQDLERRGAQLYLMEPDPRVCQTVDATYEPRLLTGRNTALDLPISNSKSVSNIELEIGELFDQWVRKTAWRDKLTFADIDTFVALRQHIRSLTISGPGLLRRTDAVVAAALDTVAPHAVCFFAVAYPYHKRMALACNKRGIPVVCYQHGGAYGTHVVPVQDFIENSHADSFLVYGPKIIPPENPLLPKRARYVPVGSARIEAMRILAKTKTALHSRQKSKLHVLFAGDVSFRNTINAGTEIEDTTRYFLETRVLSILSASDAVQVTYRPFPGDLTVQGTPEWLRRRHLPNVEIDASSKMAALLQRVDLVVTLSTSGTLWNEVLALAIPLVAYVNPSYTLLRERYTSDLARACTMCRTHAEVETVAEQIAIEGVSFLKRFADKTTDSFLRSYVLNEGVCSERAASFLIEACRHAAGQRSTDAGPRMRALR